jgi:hypothetical protein
VRRGGQRAEGRYAPRSWAVLAILVAFALTIPGGAAAATTCVGVSAPGCEASASTIQAALDAAQVSPEGDRVLVGPGRFEGPFHYSPGGSGGRIEVVGQGPATVLTAPPGSVPATVLLLVPDTAGDGSAVSNLTVRLPANANTTADTGILAEGVNNVRVASDANEAQSAEPIGVRIATPGGSLHSSVVELIGGADAGVGVETAGGSTATPVTIADSRITAPTAVKAAAQATGVVRTRVFANRRGVFACNAPVVVEDSLFRIFGSGVGLQARGDNLCSPSQASVLGRQLTVLGTGLTAGQIGAEAGSGVAGQTPSIDVSLSVFRNLQTAFRSEGTAGSTATVLVGASDFEAARHVEVPGGGTASFTQVHPNIDADPLFVNELSAEFALGAGSPAIDSAYSPPLEAGESATDLSGNPRVVDGNGDGTAARDMGAFEAPVLPDTTPPDTVLRTNAKRKQKAAAGARRFRFKVGFSSTEAGSTFQCRLDSGDFEPCSSPYMKRLVLGMHLFEVRAVDAGGNVDPTPARVRVVGVPRKKRHGHRRHREL